MIVTGNVYAESYVEVFCPLTVARVKSVKKQDGCTLLELQRGFEALKHTQCHLTVPFSYGIQTECPNILLGQYPLNHFQLIYDSEKSITSSTL